MSRKVADCRDMPSESGCTLTISGEEDEVVAAAAQHAATVHGHQDGPALRDEIRSGLKDESTPDRSTYGGGLQDHINNQLAVLSDELIIRWSVWGRDAGTGSHRRGRQPVTCATRTTHARSR
jgi:hypothetical protein